MEKLFKALALDRETLVAQWLRELLDAYSDKSARFLTNERNPFSNPVGRTFEAHIAALFDAVDAGPPGDATRGPLEALLRIRAVQDLLPSTALAFVFALKRLARQGVNAGPLTPEKAAALHELERRVDALALQAFDVYAELRALHFQLRVNEVKRQVSGLMRRTRFFEPEGAEAGPPGEDVT